MRKAALMLLTLFVVFIAACGGASNNAARANNAPAANTPAEADQPADAAMRKWIALLEKNTQLVKDGKFDEPAFKKEGQPIVDELKPLRGADGKFTLSASVNDSWQKATKAFVDVAKEKVDAGAMFAHKALQEDMLGKKLFDGKKDK